MVKFSKVDSRDHPAEAIISPTEAPASLAALVECALKVEMSLPASSIAVLIQSAIDVEVTGVNGLTYDKKKDLSLPLVSLGLLSRSHTS